MRIRVKTHDLSRRVDGMLKNARRAAARTALADCSALCLFEEGNLARSALVHSDLDAGRLVWATPYARRRYYQPVTPGKPGRAVRWAARAKQLHLEKWRQAAQKGLKEG